MLITENGNYFQIIIKVIFIRYFAENEKKSQNKGILHENM